MLAVPPAHGSHHGRSQPGPWLEPAAVKDGLSRRCCRYNDVGIAHGFFAGRHTRADVLRQDLGPLADLPVIARFVGREGPIRSTWSSYEIVKGFSLPRAPGNEGSSPMLGALGASGAVSSEFTVGNLSVSVPTAASSPA